MLAEFTLAGEAWEVRKGFPKLHLKDDWRPAQAFGAEAWAAGPWASSTGPCAAKRAATWRCSGRNW